MRFLVSLLFILSFSASAQNCLKSAEAAAKALVEVSYPDAPKSNFEVSESSQLDKDIYEVNVVNVVSPFQNPTQLRYKITTWNFNAWNKCVIDKAELF